MVQKAPILAPLIAGTDPHMTVNGVQLHGTSGVNAYSDVIEKLQELLASRYTTWSQ